MRKKFNVVITILIVTVFVIITAGCSGGSSWTFDKNNAEKIEKLDVIAYIPTDWEKHRGEGYGTDYGTSNLITRILTDENGIEVARFAIDYTGSADDPVDELMPAEFIEMLEESDEKIKGCDKVLTTGWYTSYVEDLETDWWHNEYMVYAGDGVYYIYEGSNEDYRNDEAFKAMLDACSFENVSQ